MTNFYTDKKQIINWLNKYEVKNYKLVPDEQYGFVINVSADVYLADKKLEFIPVKFSNVDGRFDCSHNKLKSLDFCPNVVGESFYCDNNKLTSLEFCPRSVGGGFNCDSNKLTSLEFCPQSVGGNFYCDLNPKLGSVQKIPDFNFIYLEHKKFLIDRLSNKLENSLNDIETKNKPNKIKL